ncbi:MAG: hypothetical protein H0S81_05140, partial [Desulfotignum balticum]|nr:hypothetical protein [Desulfotignum balticum]
MGKLFDALEKARQNHEIPEHAVQEHAIQDHLSPDQGVQSKRIPADDR